MMYRILLFVFLIYPAVYAQDAHPLTAGDLWNLQRVHSLDVSPDGKAIAVVVTSYDLKENKGNGDIYVVSRTDASVRRFTTNEGSESSPAWSPDGKSLVFVAKRGRDTKSQLYLIGTNGGEAVRLVEMPLGVSQPKWFPDGKHIAFLSKVLPGISNHDSLLAEIERRKTKKASARISEDRLYRYWDHYLTDGYLTHLFKIDVENETVTDLTPGFDRYFRYTGSGCDYDISPDGSEIILSALSEGSPYDKLFSDIYRLSADGTGIMENLTSDNPADDFSPRFTADGKYILYGKMLDTNRNAERTKLMRRDRSSGAEMELCHNFDRSPSGWVTGDDGSTVYFIANDRAKRSIFSVPMSGGAVTEIWRRGSNSALSVHDREIIFLHQNLSAPNEVYRISTGGENPSALTSFNSDLLRNVSMGSVEEEYFVGADRDSVQMYIIYPPGFDPDEKWPLLVLMHGGPHGTFGDNFHYRWNAQLFAAPGYVTITPNFHGSTGFGEQFAEMINGAHPQKPFFDVMAAVDHMLGKGFTDAARLAAAGGSYGGYLSAWVGSHTDRFKCLINHAGVYNLMAQFGSDITHGREISYGGSPWDGRDNVLRWSPSQYAAGYSTPTLVLHGEKDYRVPYSQGLELYGTLKAKKIPARLVVYPDENHWIQSPANSIHWYGEFHGWLERWIGRGAGE